MHLSQRSSMLTAKSACLQVAGVLKMRTFLSGMPECKLGLNDKVIAELNKWKAESCSV